MSAKTSNSRYGAVAVTLHWLIAIAILFMVYLGTTMEPEDYVEIQLHKSLGITILVLSILRLTWRFIDPPPPLPSGMNRLERLGANASHWTFYFLLIAIPLSGWALISASPVSDLVVTKIWGVIKLPLLPSLPSLENREDVADRLEDLHGFLAFWALLLLVGLHVAAALKHHFWNRDNVLTRMIPFLPEPRK